MPNSYNHSSDNQKILKTGKGWRWGYNPTADKYKGLLGNDQWAIELTEAELLDFCRLGRQLEETMTAMAAHLMEEERIACEAETELLWMAIEGYPQEYSLHLILHKGRCIEAHWDSQAVKGLMMAMGNFQGF